MIDVALTRGQIRDCEVAVVIDVLRATSTAVSALAAGYTRVVFAESLEDARGLRGSGRVLAGERDCIPPPGFDQGNSPREVTRPRGRELVLSTTNGAPAVIAATRAAGMVLLASMLNLQATIDALASAEGTIQVICAGAGGLASLEDVYVAGRLVAMLEGERTDAARIAETVAAAYRTPAAALRTGAGGVALRAAGLGEDIAHCARESRLPLVAVAVADGTLAVAEREAQPGGAARPCIASQTREGVHGMSM
ncbi:MAG TPA: 2-phosphosulfolactate phosphatase [Solirubrobacteraceae bacterium]|nr:2-phosphosulfolactate phosphatase [Solirubrobacteraceae bacterium]